MKCKSVEQRLPAYIEETLSPKQVNLIESHLHSCPDCQQELKGLERTIRLASSVPITYPAPELWAAFWPQLRMKIERESADGSNGFSRWMHEHAWQLASGVCLLAFLASLSVLLNLGSLKTWITDQPAPVDSLLIQNFAGEIPMNQLREQLNLELQRDEGTIIDEIHSPVTLSSDSVEKFSTRREVLHQWLQVIANEIDLEYLESEELAHPVSSPDGKLITTALD